ncbi:CRP-like cAMP-binding protein [Methylobacterium sp. B4]|nr:CRP-like cAMP-binding protein [Methylobacterium sp. B4]
MTIDGSALDRSSAYGSLQVPPMRVSEPAPLAVLDPGARTLPPGTDLIREGDRPEGLFVILDGFACRYKLRENGARQIMSFLLPGDLCDLDSSLLQRMDHGIGTLSPCSVGRLPPEQVRELQRHPSFARTLRMAALTEEAILREWIVNIGRRSAVERLAHLFCELYLRLRAVGRADKRSYLLPITQIDLADTTGMTPVHVNRSLGELRRMRLIERAGKRLTILDLPRLIEVAEFRPDYLHLDG